MENLSSPRYCELSFDGFAFRHIAAWLDHKRALAMDEKTLFSARNRRKESR